MYGEDVYVGYRYYEKAQILPLFAFGYGLSYTSFRLSDLAVSQPLQDLNNIKEEILEVLVLVGNVGYCPGAETLLVYVSPPTNARVGRPVRELKGFKKVRLEPGETQGALISIPIGLATSYWDESRSAWLSEAGTYVVTVVGTGEENFMSETFTMKRTRAWNGLLTPAQHALF